MAKADRWAARLFFAVDKKPSKVNRPVGSPDMLRAVTAAQGPGRAETGIPAWAHWRTKSSPGSEMAGVPASETRAQHSPASSRSRIRPPLAVLLCS